MNQQDFCYWLNGFIELNGGKMPTPAQWKSICEHLSLVFNKVTPEVKKTEPLTDLDKLIKDASEKIEKGKKKDTWVQPLPLPTLPFPPRVPADYPFGPIITC